MQQYYERNQPSHEEFVRLLGQRTDERDRAEVKEFHACVQKLHNAQWSEHIWNIVTATSQCPNRCRYCYMTSIRQHFYGVELVAQDAPIEDMRISEKAITKNWRKVAPCASGARDVKNYL